MSDMTREALVAEAKEWEQYATDSKCASVGVPVRVLSGLLSLLASEGAKVKELEAKVEQRGRTIGRIALPDIEYRDKLRSQAMAAEDRAEQLSADRVRLVGEVQQHVEAYKSAHDRAEKAEAEVTRLRTALIASGRAAGALLADDVSTDFLMHVPDEVKAEVTRLTADWAALVRHIKASGCECSDDMQCAGCYLRDRVAELEAQR